MKDRALRYAAVLLVLIALSACASSRKGTLVFTGLGGEPDTLNPLVSSSADLFDLSHLYMSFLVESDGRGKLVPEIAEVVPTVRNGGISEDGRTMVYHLRRGIRWQDGAPLDARDVLFTYHAVMNPANNVASRVGYAEIDAIRAPDARTVVVHLRRPFSPIVAYFFASQGYATILPAHLLAKYPDLNRVAYNERPVGSGPFRVVQWRHGDSITFEANPLYWRGKPRIDRIVYRIIPDPNTRMEQLQTGEADAYLDVDPQLLPQVRALHGVKISMTPVNDLHVLQFNMGDAVVGDLRVRQAVARAIDRKKLIEAATHGAGIDVDGDQPFNSWAHDRTAHRIFYDPQGARRLLDAAGWHAGPNGVRVKNGHTLDLTLAIAPQGISGSALVATIVQRNLHDVGVGVTIKQYPPALMWGPKAAGGVMANGHYQLAYYAWWVLGPDPDDTWNFACDQIPPAGQNFYFWCNRRADAAMHEALQHVDQTQRARDYAIVQHELQRDLPEITLWQVRMPDAYRTRLRGIAPSPAGSTFWNAWTWKV
ncbi:MAG: ABC transporter substrate-binding protein [Vulcanimicrobiaceae bacterium]